MKFYYLDSPLGLIVDDGVFDEYEYVIHSTCDFDRETLNFLEGHGIDTSKIFKTYRNHTLIPIDNNTVSYIKLVVESAEDKQIFDYCDVILRIASISSFNKMR